MAQSRVAVIVVSLGDRPWFPIARHWLERYCERCGFELIVHTQPLLIDLGSEEFDRYKNFGRLQKLGIGRHFADFDRIIQLDDTCLISPATPNVAELVPEHKIGCWIEGKVRTGSWFQGYLAIHQRGYGRQNRLPPERFYNTGVAVYGSRHASLFEVSRELLRPAMLDRAFPDQGFLSHMAEQRNLQLHDLGHAYNLVGSIIRASRGPEPLLDQGFHIFHLTGAVEQYRVPIAQAIDLAFRRRWPA